jgi:putative peptidoglycan lipid II flippase
VYPSLAAAGSVPEFARTLAGTARSVVLLACFGGAALAALAGPAAYLVGTRGAAPGIVGFAPGLLGYALFALLSRALYARGRTVAAAAATAAGWGIAAIAAVVFTAALGDDWDVFGLGLANAVGMSAIGLLLVLAVRRHTGAASLAGLGRAAGVGIVAAIAAALAGWAAVAGAGHAFGPVPTAIGSIVQGILGAVVVAVVFVAVAYPLDRDDVRPLATMVARRVRRDRGEERA